MTHLIRTLQVSERMAWRLAGLSRSARQGAATPLTGALSLIVAKAPTGPKTNRAAV